uniref:NADH-ubiquinone oxidoreductase chain 4 n=1 Tax=Xenophyes cascus TaxID=984453 RepID=L7NB20_9HEMI|nr:NADH dehydrogenase subunit 4 [Xenophyes cascus]
MLSYGCFVFSFWLFCIFNFWWEIICGLIFMLLLFISGASFFNFFSMVSYSWGADFISLSLVFLSVWIVMLILVASIKVWWMQVESPLFVGVILSLLIILFFIFFVYDLFMFYIFFEGSLVPMLILIFGWGSQPERLISVLYLLMYTVLASLPLLFLIFSLYGYSYSTVYFFPQSGEVNFIVFSGFIMGFLVKMPLFGFHLWLLRAHVEAPVSGSMLLAGVLLKLGGYGMIRMLSLIGFMDKAYSLVYFVLGVGGSIVIGCLCLVQVDTKLLIAYSSVAHMGLVVGGILTLTQWGLTGSLIMMVAHGLCSSGLFCLSNLMYERLGGRSLLLNRGFMSLSPPLTLFCFLLCSSNMASPPSLNMAGEVFLSVSILSWGSLGLSLIMGGCFLGGAYNLYLFSCTQHGCIYSGMKTFKMMTSCEFMLLILHWLPLNLMIFLLEMFLL